MKMAESEKLFLGIDVGTGSVRAGLFDAAGTRRGMGVEPIGIWHPSAEWAEQSSEDIWRAAGIAIRAALADAEAKPEAVAGIGVDATCSLVVLDAEDRPLPVSPEEDPERNVIVWMDHRAIDQANRINATGAAVLRYSGGTVSPEMETPKLLWLKENNPATWQRAARFLDLADFLTYRATGDDTRSLCTTVCKWTYRGDRLLEEGEGGWDAPFLESIGLGELTAEGAARIGGRVRPMGEPVGHGLTEEAAADLGLAAGTAVGVGIIDAHAGGLGMIGVPLDDAPPDREAFNRRVALIGGTSSCHMAIAPEPRFLPGIWGPYASAMVPDWWLTEGGQSATGALVDHLIEQHAAAAAMREEAARAGESIYDRLNSALETIARDLPFPAAVTRGLHIYPDFHGNRSPRADPSLLGMISGLNLDRGAGALARQYLAGIQGVAYGTRHILEEMNRGGYAIDTILMCGGGTRNPVFLREHADICGCSVVLPREPEAVLLGSAILGAVAAGGFPGIPEAMAAMTAPGTVIEPAGGAVQTYHECKYKIFHRMHDDQLAYRRMMEE